MWGIFVTVLVAIFALVLVAILAIVHQNLHPNSFSHSPPIMFCLSFILVVCDGVGVFTDPEVDMPESNELSTSCYLLLPYRLVGEVPKRHPSQR